MQFKSVITVQNNPLHMICQYCDHSVPEATEPSTTELRFKGPAISVLVAAAAAAFGFSRDECWPLEAKHRVVPPGRHCKIKSN